MKKKKKNFDLISRNNLGNDIVDHLRLFEHR